MTKVHAIFRIAPAEVNRGRPIWAPGHRHGRSRSGAGFPDL